MFELRTDSSLVRASLCTIFALYIQNKKYPYAYNSLSLSLSLSLSFSPYFTFMARKPNHVFSLLVVFLCLGLLFVSIQARPIHTAPYHRHIHKISSRPRQGGKNHNISRRYSEVLALRGIKNSGPSPGEGNTFVNGVHNRALKLNM